MSYISQAYPQGAQPANMVPFTTAAVQGGQQFFYPQQQVYIPQTAATQLPTVVGK